ncbi:unnamed protein product [Phytomonas sp. EM1]|nr:unnamed protein product [Phytomonas sp. EM1]|eukprot:CCW64668.1 unnamed protein product [Phytomonas sp. isolate EM1]
MEADANLAQSMGSRSENSMSGVDSPMFDVSSTSPPARYPSYSDSTQDDVAVAIEILERHVEFMTFFYQHVTTSPPHGPFRYYTAITLVERAKKRFGKRRSLADDPHRAGATTAESRDGVLPEAKGPAQGSGDVGPTFHHHRRVLEVLSVRNILALIERKYNTRHLGSWPLLYVPAEVHATDLQRPAS